MFRKVLIFIFILTGNLYAEFKLTNLINDLQSPWSITIVKKNTYLITNRHVVADNRYVKVKWEDGSLDKAVVIASAKNSDLYKRNNFRGFI